MENKQLVNLIYAQDKSQHGNFGDELSKAVTQWLIDKEKYRLVYNQKRKVVGVEVSANLVCIGSYIHRAVDNSYIYGSGVRTPNNIEKGHHYKNLKVCAVRGPLTKKFLEKKKLKVPRIFGDPALLLPRFYQPEINSSLKNKIGVIPHKSCYTKYVGKINESKFHLISPTSKWEEVINQICSCQAVISSSLHGLICSDAYGIPNVWLNQFKLKEGEFKFKDYFKSQKRDLIKIKSLQEYRPSLLYKGGNTINLNKLINNFPFR